MPSLAVTLVVVPAALLEVVLLPTPTLLLVLLVLLELPPLIVLLRADPEALLALVNPLAGLVLKLVLVLLLPTHPRWRLSQPSFGHATERGRLLRPQPERLHQSQDRASGVSSTEVLLYGRHQDRLLRAVLLIGLRVHW